MPSFSHLVQPLQRSWQRLQPRERQALGVACAVLTLYLLWAVAIAPAWRTLRDVPAQQNQAEQQLADLRALAQQAQALQTRQRSQPLQREQALRHLETTTTQILGRSARLEPGTDRVTVRLDQASPEALAQWLAQTRINARLLPQESQLQRSVTDAAPSWSGTVVLTGPVLSATAP